MQKSMASFNSAGPRFSSTKRQMTPKATFSPCSRDATVLEAKTAQKRIGLDNVLHGLGQLAALGCGVGRAPVPHQDLVAGPRDLRAGDRRGIAVANVIVRPEFEVGSCLVPGGKRVADTGDEERDGSTDDQGAIYQRDIRVPAAAHDAIIDALGRDDTDRTGRRIRRGDRRDGRDPGADVEGGDLGGVERLYAADTDDDARLRGPAFRHASRDLGIGGFTAEAHEAAGDAALSEAVERQDHAEEHPPAADQRTSGRAG